MNVYQILMNMRKTNPNAILIAKYIKEWLNVYIPCIQNGSNHTIRNAKLSLSLFINFLETKESINYDTFDFECFSKKIIEKWIIWLKNERKCLPETCNVRLTSIRSFLKFLSGKDIALIYLYQEARTIPRQKVCKRKVFGISKNAIKTLLRMPDISSSTGRKYRTLFLLLYATATRINEILSMKIKSLSLEGKDPNITVFGKGGKFRRLPLVGNLVTELKRYINEFHGQSPNMEAYLFYSRNGGILCQMTPESVNKQLKKYAFAAHNICSDVPIDIHSHQLRHAKASHWLKDGMNIVQISFLLGHSNLQTTMTYLDITLEDERNALVTIEEEKQKKCTPIWKKDSYKLSSFIGLMEIK